MAGNADKNEPPAGYWLAPARNSVACRTNMLKIIRISAYRVLLPLEEGSYRWSDSKAITQYDSTIVRIDTDAGITGWGEVCPLGPVYLPAYANGARTGIAELAPALIGRNPLELDGINAVMDATLKGHPYCKNPLDIACWDILGKHARLPLASLLGGRFGADFAVYRSISQEPPKVMADWVATHQRNGFRHFQLKVGGVADEDIERIRAVAALMQPGGKLVCDANTGWLTPPTRCGYAARWPISTSTSSSPACRTRNARRCGDTPTCLSSSTNRSTTSARCCEPTPMGRWMSST